MWQTLLRPPLGQIMHIHELTLAATKNISQPPSMFDAHFSSASSDRSFCCLWQRLADENNKTLLSVVISFGSFSDNGRRGSRPSLSKSPIFRLREGRVPPRPRPKAVKRKDHALPCRKVFSGHGEYGNRRRLRPLRIVASPSECDRL